MTLRRLPDEDPQNLADPAYRRRRIILQNMKDEELAIAQVEEKQAVAAVLSGKYTMTGEAFEPVEVDMGRSAGNNITQAGAAAWSSRDKKTYDPTDDSPCENEEGEVVRGAGTLALDSNVLLLDTMLALNYVIKQLETTQKELQELKLKIAES